MLTSWLKSRGGGQTINSSQRRRQDYLRRKKIGAVLIEFAFSIPVFLVLIYYIHDLPKMKLIQRKNQFVANIMAATIQNISKQCQAASRNFTATDLDQAFRLSLLATFPGMTSISAGSNWQYMPLGILPLVHVFCYVGNSDGTATLKKRHRRHPEGGVNIGGQINNSTFYNDTVVNINATQPQAIYKDLKIQPGERKVIIDYGMYNHNSMFFGSSGKRVNTVPLKSIWGFLFYTPVSPDKNKNVYFHAVTIFNPIWNFENSL